MSEESSNRPDYSVADSFDQIERDVLVSQAMRLMAMLTPNERYVLAERVMKGRPTRDVGDELSVSPRQVRRLVTSALRSVALAIGSSGESPSILAAQMEAKSGPDEPIVVKLPGLLGPDGRPIEASSREGRLLEIKMQGFWEALLNELKRNPELLRTLPSRRFEELCAELLSRDGYQVELTRGSKDGGVDLYAVRRDSLGAFLSLVQCKRYSARNPVGVGVLRELYGVVQAKRANAGVIATTSSFTRGALAEQQSVSFQIKLRDYDDIHEWIARQGT